MPLAQARDRGMRLDPMGFLPSTAARRHQPQDPPKLDFGLMGLGLDAHLDLTSQLRQQTEGKITLRSPPKLSFWPALAISHHPCTDTACLAPPTDVTPFPESGSDDTLPLLYPLLTDAHLPIFLLSFRTLCASIPPKDATHLLFIRMEDSLVAFGAIPWTLTSSPLTGSLIPRDPTQTNHPCSLVTLQNRDPE
ncbi:uncharacterized protein CLUP02_10310 [Colletotrichum lupini]|uniref:Uncharacterized protein n=1 Tax=Colletotrichum lupini TaxID=145971 RepID=A0A9Q8SWH3_9PEZI|nr:uncharacterized protein CLUP02_10310 [Colletotrichum lupini]UQC84814.1 hypothetical protein CLUP02_10310 [Colletotrichum lupini]